MKNTSFLNKLSLCALLFHSTPMTAQQTKTVVTDSKTDKQYANTTEIYKSDKASDSQVLAEIDGNFGIGDVVRIAIAPPKTTPVPVAKPTTVSTTKAPNLVVYTPVSTNLPIIQAKSTIPSVQLDEPKMVSTPVVNQVKSPIAENTTDIVTSVTSEKKEDLNTVKRDENPAVVKTNRAMKSGNSVKSAKSTKSSSRKSISLFNNFSFSFSKRVKAKGGKKYGCYRF
jgi:hypothetical protein